MAGFGRQRANRFAGGGRMRRERTPANADGAHAACDAPDPAAIVGSQADVPTNAPAAADAPPRPARRRPEPSPAQRALALLVRREHSRKELARKLEVRGVGAEDAEAAVARMAAEGWQDDARFAASLARSRAAAGYGPAWIRAELGSHGLDGALVEHAFAALRDEDAGDDWVARARALALRRYGPACADDPALRRKAADLLYRRGFDADSVRAALRFDDES